MHVSFKCSTPVSCYARNLQIGPIIAFDYLQRLRWFCIYHVFNCGYLRIFSIAQRCKFNILLNCVYNVVTVNISLTMTELNIQLHRTLHVTIMNMKSITSILTEFNMTRCRKKYSLHLFYQKLKIGLSDCSHRLNSI